MHFTPHITRREALIFFAVFAVSFIVLGQLFGAGFRPKGTEIVELRAYNSKTFSNGDGTLYTQLAPARIHFWDGSAWHDLDELTEPSLASITELFLSKKPELSPGQTTFFVGAFTPHAAVSASKERESIVFRDKREEAVKELTPLFFDSADGQKQKGHWGLGAEGKRLLLFTTVRSDFFERAAYPVTVSFEPPQRESYTVVEVPFIPQEPRPEKPAEKPPAEKPLEEPIGKPPEEPPSEEPTEKKTVRAAIERALQFAESDSIDSAEEFYAFSRAAGHSGIEGLGIKTVELETAYFAEPLYFTLTHGFSLPEELELKSYSGSISVLNPLFNASLQLIPLNYLEQLSRQHSTLEEDIYAFLGLQILLLRPSNELFDNSPILMENPALFDSYMQAFDGAKIDEHFNRKKQFLDSLAVESFTVGELCKRNAFFLEYGLGVRESGINRIIEAQGADGRWSNNDTDTYYCLWALQLLER